MRKFFRRDLQPFFNPETLWSFLLGSVSLGIFVNAAYDLIVNLMTADSGQSNVRLCATIASICVLVVVLAAFFFQRSIHRAMTATMSPEMTKPTKRLGLILLVSDRDDKVCRAAFDYHAETLQRCWLICSENSKPIADRFRAEHSKVCLDEPFVVKSVLQPIETYRAVKKAIESIPEEWTLNDVIADYTGMTSHASVGTSLACLFGGIAMQYTPPKTFDDQGRPKEPDEPYEVRLVVKRSRKSETSVPSDEIN